MTATKLNGTSY